MKRQQSHFDPLQTVDVSYLMQMNLWTTELALHQREQWRGDSFYNYVKEMPCMFNK